MEQWPSAPESIKSLVLFSETWQPTTLTVTWLCSSWLPLHLLTCAPRVSVENLLSSACSSSPARGPCVEASWLPLQLGPGCALLTVLLKQRARTRKHMEALWSEFMHLTPRSIAKSHSQRSLPSHAVPTRLVIWFLHSGRNCKQKGEEPVQRAATRSRSRCELLVSFHRPVLWVTPVNLLMKPGALLRGESVCSVFL